MINTGNLWINLIARIDFDDKMLAIDFVKQWIKNKELMVTWLKIDLINVMLITWFLQLGILITNAIWLINSVYCMDCILVAFLVEQLVPSGEH